MLEHLIDLKTSFDLHSFGFSYEMHLNNKKINMNFGSNVNFDWGPRTNCLELPGMRSVYCLQGRHHIVGEGPI